MSTRESYRNGQSLGTEYADADRHEHAASGAIADELRADAVEARSDISRPWRAFKLGIVRGYRESTRTLLGGRWGT